MNVIILAFTCFNLKLPLGGKKMLINYYYPLSSYKSAKCVTSLQVLCQCSKIITGKKE